MQLVYTLNDPHTRSRQSYSLVDIKRRMGSIDQTGARQGSLIFTIGNYDAPNIGIEFSLKHGWSSEEVDDFLKLLDKKNPFNVSISFNVIFRKKELVRGKYLEGLEKHMNDAFKEAVNRLSERWDASREVYLIITEIDRNNNRRHWHYDRTSGKFQKGLPAIDVMI